MLARLIVVIILNINIKYLPLISNHVVHLKVKLCHMSAILQFFKKAVRSLGGKKIKPKALSALS